MRLLVMCQHCLLSGRQTTLGLAEYTDSGFFELTCPEGHKSKLRLQQPKYEVLFQLGCEAILDGYYREAVSSFAASLERFHEHALRTLLREPTGSDDLFGRAWKHVKNQSERQVGAFIFLWTSMFRDVPPVLSSDRSGFRNEVIHKGRIPKREEAVDFGQCVLEILTSMAKTLVSRFEAALLQVTFDHLREMSGVQEEDGPITTVSRVFITENAMREDKVDLVAHLRQLQEDRARVLGTGFQTTVGAEVIWTTIPLSAQKASP